MNIKKFAAIDVGSNAIRLLFMHVYESLPPVFEKASLVRVPVRLGEDVFTRGYITPYRQDLLLETLMGFSYLIRANEVDNYKACATSAMREASNGRDVVARMARATGIQIGVISGLDEARIIYLNQVAEMIDPANRTLYVDVGGGSTELTLFQHNEALASESFRIGTVRMLKQQVDETEWSRMKRWVREQARGEKPTHLIGSGGNINKIIKLVRGGKGGNKFLKGKELELLYNDLLSLDVEDRMIRYSLNPDRADVIVPAADIFLHILQWSGCKDVYVPKIGLADGMCREMYRNSQRTSRPGSRSLVAS